MRKRRNKFLCMLLVCCLLAPVFVSWGTIEASASSEQPYVAQVGDTKYENYFQAWDAVKNGGTLTMLADWHTAEMLMVEKNASITVNMNGYMINRGLTAHKESGAIFWIGENGSLALNGNGVNSTERWGTVRNGKWYYQENGKGTVKINGSLLTGGYNDDGGAAIHIQENAEVRINGVTIAGNACSEGNAGGAICLQGERSKLYLTNSTVSYNRSDGGGAAIFVEGIDSNVEISNTKIHHNLVGGDHGDGGAIRMNNGSVEVKGSTLSFNDAGRNGGAVYVYNGNLTIDKDTVISHNNANKEGGAVYVDSNADQVRIEGRFIGNQAVEEGGAVYVNSNIDGDNGVKISNAEMIGNVAQESGGAVYVDSDNKISLFGTVVMQGNSPDNLHIRHEENISENNLTEGSRIGIFTSWTATKDYFPVETGNHQYFFSDKIGYEIKGNSGELYFVKCSEGAPSTYKVGDIEYEMIKGAFPYEAYDGYMVDSYFYYSDGYFAEAPKYYNEHLASLSACVALAAMPPSVYEGEYTEDKAAKFIIDLFGAMGYSDIFVHYPDPEYFGENSENLSTIGYVIAQKTIVINGVETTVVATALRGSGYGAEWVSNVIIGSGLGEAKGFGDAAKQVKQGIEDYVTERGINADSVKFFITGHSRAGAASNLVAKKLSDIYGEDKVYAYCFESPKSGVFAELQDGLTYANIHNIINRTDIFTTMGTEQMGFIRYGVDHMAPRYSVGSVPYEAQKKIMLAHLAALSEKLAYNDDFHEATVEYVLYKLGIADLIEQIKNAEFDYAEDWIPYFVEKIQEYSMTDMEDKSDPKNNDNIFNNESNNWYGYRNFYADYEWYLYFDETDEIKLKSYATKPDDFDSGRYTVLSLEDALANLMMLYYGSSAEKTAAIFGSLDVDAIMEKIDLWKLYTVIINEWNGLGIDKKNKEFNDLWKSLDFENILRKAFSEEEIREIKASFYVAADFVFDFVAEDYDQTSQNIVGTLVYNIGAILQTHKYDMVYSWVRSCDSFYSDINDVCDHSYGEWSLVKEATAEEHGVQMKTCIHCGESVYESIPKIVTEENDSETSDKDNAKISTSLFIGILLASVVLIVVSSATCFYIRRKKNVFTSQKDDE